jgi:hypothetical protein
MHVVVAVEVRQPNACAARARDLRLAFRHDVTPRDTTEDGAREQCAGLEKVAIQPNETGRVRERPAKRECEVKSHAQARTDGVGSPGRVLEAGHTNHDRRRS